MCSLLIRLNIACWEVEFLDKEATEFRVLASVLLRSLLLLIQYKGSLSSVPLPRQDHLSADIHTVQPLFQRSLIRWMLSTMAVLFPPQNALKFITLKEKDTRRY
ncbi:hypothetical protein E3U43_015503 [Larimichthys crocea]|uniref:Uncharacterized protein n=1 Tax=Larimichthys crocea TaxID=215358 RepID=A0ACD3RQ58_LARCR|nr:hypothetical protein E3U43_015503 [Larimichthys crocea]